jgi:hypothetical protein
MYISRVHEVGGRAGLVTEGLTMSNKRAVFPAGKVMVALLIATKVNLRHRGSVTR